MTHHVDHEGAGGLPLELPIRVAGAQVEEACAALVRDSVRQQRLAAALGSIQQHRARSRHPERMLCTEVAPF